MFICMQKNQLHISLLLWDIVKTLQSYLFWELWKCLTISIKNQIINLYETFMLVCMQRINFITHFFLKTLQRNTKFVILGNLRISGHTHLKWKYQFQETFDVHLQAKNELHPSRFPWDIVKILQTYYFGYFEHAWLHTPKVVSETFAYNNIKINFISHVFLEILQRQLPISGTLGMPVYAHSNR